MHQQYFQDHVLRVNHALDAYLATWSQETIAHYPKLADLISEFVKANDGGKRLRAVLVMLGYEMITGYYDESLLPAALAYELFQTSILAHDDIIDISDLRRGKATLHKAIEHR